MLTKEELKQLLAASGGGDNYFFGDDVTFIKEQNITVQSGGNFFNGSQGSQKKEETTSEDDEKMKKVLDDMLEETIEGDKMFTEQYQWFAVYRVLNEKVNYPKKMTDFFRRMTKLGYDKVKVACVYTSLKQGSQSCPKLIVPVDQWGDYKDISDQYAAMYKVADFLLKRLGFKK